MTPWKATCPERLGASEKRDLSYGEAKNRRKVLSEARKKESPAEKRLNEINHILSPDDQTLSKIKDVQERERTQAKLEIEEIWLKFKLDMMSSKEKKQLLERKFDELEEIKPHVYKWLFAKTAEDGLSMAEQIRDEVMIPIRHVGVYFTKR